jgi:archaellum biogenesis ATPase FlaH
MPGVVAADPGLLDNVPAELRARPQWVAWRAVPKPDGKIDKIPINPATGGNAATNNPSTWNTFQRALGRMRANSLAGIGYVFAADDPYTGIDYDGCRDPQTGEFQMWAFDCIQAFNSYSEVSPSGKGVHTFVRGKLPGGGGASPVGTPTGHIEVYDRGRFFTVTGAQVLTTPAAISDGGDTLAQFYATYYPGEVNGHKRAEPVPDKIAKGTQHRALVSLAGSMRRRGMSVDEIEAALLVTNAKRLEDPAPPGNIRAIAESVCTLYLPSEESGTNRATPIGKSKLTETTGPILLNMADVVPKPVRWLWPGHIPLGKLTIIDGDPGLGKSLMTLDLAARVSVGGPMPDGVRGDVCGPAGVVLLTAEDDPEDTIRPRLDAAGADCKRIVILEAIEDIETASDGTEKRSRRLPTLADVDAIAEAIRTIDAALVIVDPVMAYLAGTDTHIDAEVRRVLVALAGLAQRTGVAIVVVRHLNKSAGGNPLYRGGGSIGFIAAARSGLLVAPDPQDSTGRRRIVASTKSNLSELPRALAYQVAQTETSIYVEWLGGSDQTAKTLLAEPVECDDEDDSTLGEARDFLRTLLTAGPVDARSVQREAREAGIPEHVLRRAKPTLGVVTRRVGGIGAYGRWEWSMTDSRHATEPNMTKPTAPPEIGMLGNIANAPHVRQQGCLPTICPHCKSEMDGPGETEEGQERWRCAKCATVIWLPEAR